MDGRTDWVVGASAVFLVTLTAASFAMHFLAPLDRSDQDLLARNLSPFSGEAVRLGHWLGTDQLGRDQLARLLHAGRVSVLVALLTVLISGVVGTVLGVIAGYRRGWVDDVVMRVVDVQLAFPTILLAIFALFVLGPGFTSLIVVLSLIRWPLYARVARSQVLALRSTPAVEAARVIGCSQARILLWYIAPPLLPALITVAALGIAQNILTEAGLSFLGLGVQPPSPSWGLMLAQGRNYMTNAPWLMIVPGTAIVLTALSVNLIAHAVRQVADPLQTARRA